ncbi:BCCT family transporter [Metabacillus litoralis]|uniref:glycine betaine uptake BCCT transporter n=2 Tax=Metabacillus TaxID=2675233 RepID=UPI000EF60EE4|nr:BCCT family transporter [Metabacillus litoralis]MCM3160276.1 BCCT family transporter [Metabacillus litoralis]MCM3408860.1 BCCT family transporter [Metabacillus litoralis]UHA59490.1 BCCT family transporter [Metabacillus litoralis]
MEKVSKVFWISIVIASIFVGWGVIAPAHLGAVMDTTKAFFLSSFGWFYQLSATFFLIFAIFLIFSKYGKIKLGADDDKPEFKRSTWFAMLFSAGMGIGLLFFGVSEPVSHFANPPIGEGGTGEAAKVALRYTYLHWGFHAWAIYAVIALVLAYYKFRKKEPGLMSVTLTPLLGRRATGVIGIIIDVVAVFATIFGVAASLGLGAAQINSGLSYIAGIPNNFTVQLIIISIVTVLFILSASTGIQKGIKYLSNANMALAVILLIVFLILAPTRFVLDLFTTTLGSYIQNLPSMGLRLAPFNEESASWIQGWTIFYWAWWIAWAPFVGTFIARVSKGRTVREFMVAVLVIPTLVCAFWFAVFGGTGIYFEFFKGLNVSGQSLETVIFFVYQQLPLTGLLIVVTLMLITTFFITSADSATFVLGMQTAHGSLNPPNIVKIVWGFFLSASAIVLMLSGGLNAMQTAIIVSAFPLTFVLIAMSFSILKDFNLELKARKSR